MADEALSFILASKVRTSILHYLRSKIEASPAVIARDQQMHLSHVCRALSELRTRQLVASHRSLRGRESYYTLTETGYELLYRMAILGR